MDAKKYERYLDEISARYSISMIEAEALFKMAIAKAYDAYGSAYVWEDGTITLAMDTNSAVFRIKNYIISQKQYAKIVKIFEALLFDYAQKSEALKFANVSKETLIQVEIIEETHESYIVKPCVSSGAIGGYRFILRKNKLFYKEEFLRSQKIECVCKGFYEKEGAVFLTRFDKQIARNLFLRFYKQCMESLGKYYEFKSVGIHLNPKSKAVTFIVDWKTRPSTTVISFLTKELQSVLGRCSIVYKELKHAS